MPHLFYASSALRAYQTFVFDDLARWLLCVTQYARHSTRCTDGHGVGGDATPRPWGSWISCEEIEDGGELQMLKVVGVDQAHLEGAQANGAMYPVEWKEIPNPYPGTDGLFAGTPANDVAAVFVGDQGRFDGAAGFSRLREPSTPATRSTSRPPRVAVTSRQVRRGSTRRLTARSIGADFSPERCDDDSNIDSKQAASIRRRLQCGNANVRNPTISGPQMRTPATYLGGDHQPAGSPALGHRPHPMLRDTGLTDAHAVTEPS